MEKKISLTAMAMRISVIMALITICYYSIEAYNDYSQIKAIKQLNTLSRTKSNKALLENYHSLNALIADINIHEKMELAELKQQGTKSAFCKSREEDIKTFAMAMRDDFTETKERLLTQYTDKFCKKIYGKTCLISDCRFVGKGLFLFTVSKKSLFSGKYYPAGEIAFDIEQNHFASASTEPKLFQYIEIAVNPSYQKLAIDSGSTYLKRMAEENNKKQKKIKENTIKYIAI